MKKYLKFIPVVAMVSLAGCSNMSDTDQRVLSGAAIGTVGGAAVGALVGHNAAGALIGAGAGALVGGVAGYITDRSQNDDY